ncbi:hypothetical protein BGZ73_000807, partial [Actinomortierella ambigua]
MKGKEEDEKDKTRAEENNTLQEQGQSGIQAHALALPEILSLVGQQLDMATLARALRVCKLWHSSFVPILWSALTIDGSHRRYASSASLDRWLDLLEPHVHYTRSLALLVQNERSRSFVESDSAVHGHHPDDIHLQETIDEDSGEDHLQPLQIIARILSLRSATSIQSITFQTISPIHSILLSAQRVASLERLDIQTLGGGPPELYLSDAFYAYPQLRHLRLGPFVSSSSSTAVPSTTLGSEVITTPMLHSSKFLALQTLELHNVSWPAKDMLLFTACCPDLRSLAITGRARTAWDWTIETADTLAQHCPRLGALHLHPRFGTTVGEAVLVRLLERLPAAQWVKLSIPNCQFGTALYNLLMMPYSQQRGRLDGGCGGNSENDGRRRIECLSTLNVSYSRMPGISPRQLTSLLARA